MFYQIVRQQDLTAHIQNALMNINNGLYNWNQIAGQQVKMPSEVKFDLMLIDTFQSLPVVTNEGGTNTTLQTGTDVAVTSGTTTDAPPSGGNSQTTTHGETVDTSDTEDTTYTGYDPTAALATGSSDTPNITGP